MVLGNGDANSCENPHELVMVNVPVAGGLYNWISPDRENVGPLQPEAVTTMLLQASLSSIEAELEFTELEVSNSL